MVHCMYRVVTGNDFQIISFLSLKNNLFLVFSYKDHMPLIGPQNHSDRRLGLRRRQVGQLHARERINSGLYKVNKVYHV